MIIRNLTSKTQGSNQIQFGSVFTKTSSMVSKLNSVTRLSEVNNQPDENNGNLNIGKPGFGNHTWDSILKVTESRKPKHSNRYSIHRKSFKTRSSVQNQGSSKNSLQVSNRYGGCRKGGFEKRYCNLNPGRFHKIGSINTILNSISLNR